MKLQLSLLFALATLCCHCYAAEESTKEKRQVGSTVIDNKEDHQGAESHFGHHVAASGKYFQYTHVPAKDHYEFGHKRGNEHHFIERHEKAHPHNGEFKTKVRWGDKHGGYGEHHWDYNHAGHDDHHGHHGEESQQEPEYAAYEQESKPVPKYAASASAPAPLGALAAGRRGKRQHDVTDGVDEDVEFISEHARSLVLSGVTGKHGGNYRKAPAYERGKREGEGEVDGQDLVFRPDTGLIVDEKTGIKYKLQPVE